MSKREPKDPAVMQPSEINKELDALDKRDTKNTRAFIDAGRGYELPSERRDKTDPLTLEERAIYLRRSALKNEIERRYGPGAPNRMPKGLRPIGAPPRRKHVKVVSAPVTTFAASAPVPAGVERSSPFYPSPNYHDPDNSGGGVESEDYESLCVDDDSRA